ncbi:MAG: hypothetical protein WAK20_00795 [Candidatus Acidiferrum sp.]
MPTITGLSETRGDYEFHSNQFDCICAYFRGSFNRYVARHRFTKATTERRHERNRQAEHGSGIHNGCLALGLLIASAKSSCDVQYAALVDTSAKVVVLDRVLAHYGPETGESREMLRDSVAEFLERAWPKDSANPLGLEAPAIEKEILFDTILGLSPQDENQRSLKTQALSIAWDIGQTRWMQCAHYSRSVSMPLLVTLAFWLTTIFVSFGLFSPRNVTVAVCMLISAASVSSAILMILEMYNPYSGIIRLPSGL